MLLSVFLLQRDLKKMKKSDIVLFLGLWSARVRFGAAVSARAHREAEGIETVVLTNLSKRSLQAGGGDRWTDHIVCHHTSSSTWHLPYSATLPHTAPSESGQSSSIVRACVFQAGHSKRSEGTETSDCQRMFSILSTEEHCWCYLISAGQHVPSPASEWARRVCTCLWTGHITGLALPLLMASSCDKLWNTCILIPTKAKHMHVLRPLHGKKKRHRGTKLSNS